MPDTVTWQVRDLPLETRQAITYCAARYQVKTAVVIKEAMVLLLDYLDDSSNPLPDGFDEWMIDWIKRR